MKKRIDLIFNIVVVIVLIGYLINFIASKNRFIIAGVTDFQQSQMSIEGLNSSHGRRGPISPNWKWVVHFNKDSYIEIALIGDPSIILFDPKPEKIKNLFFWSPDGHSFVAETEWGTDIVLYNIRNDQVLEKVKIDMSSVPFCEMFGVRSTKRIAWSPDGQFLALICDTNRLILIIDNNGNYLQTIQVQDESEFLTGILDDLTWNKKGLVYSWHDSESFDYHSWNTFRWMFISKDQQSPPEEIITIKGFPESILIGMNDKYILLSNRIAFSEFELILVNLDTHKIEKSIKISARSIRKTEIPLQDGQYSTFIISQGYGYKDALGIFDWNTLEFKQHYIENYSAVTGWSPALDGIGVLATKNKKLELWVVKP